MIIDQYKRLNSLYPEYLQVYMTRDAYLQHISCLHDFFLNPQMKKSIS